MGWFGPSTDCSCNCVVKTCECLPELGSADVILPTGFDGVCPASRATKPCTLVDPDYYNGITLLCPVTNINGCVWSSFANPYPPTLCTIGFNHQLYLSVYVYFFPNGWVNHPSSPDIPTFAIQVRAEDLTNGLIIWEKYVDADNCQALISGSPITIDTWTCSPRCPGIGGSAGFCYYPLAPDKPIAPVTLNFYSS